MVGGKLIEIKRVTIPETGIYVDRLWVVGTGCEQYDELCVYAEPADVMPKLGDTIWWQSGQIMFDGDRQSLKKIGFSFPPNSSKPRS